MDTQHRGKDSDKGKSRIISTGKARVDVGDRPFILTKSKSSNAFISDVFEWEWMMVMGDPTNHQSYREYPITLGAVERLIKDLRMTRTERGEYGEVWEEPGAPYKEMFGGIFARRREENRLLMIERKARKEEAAIRNRAKARLQQETINNFKEWKQKNGQ